MAKKTSKQKPYARQWQRLQDLKQQACASRFERATLAVGLFDDVEWREHMGLADDHQAADILTKALDDLGIPFFDLRQMLEAFPAEQDWLEMTPFDMLVAAQAQEAKPEQNAPPKPPTVVGITKYEEVCNERDRLQRRVEQLESHDTPACVGPCDVLDAFMRIADANRDRGNDPLLRPIYAIIDSVAETANTPV